MKENLFRALQDNIYKHRTSIAKDFYIDELDNVINELNNTYLSTTIMKPVDIKSSKYINFVLENKSYI